MTPHGPMTVSVRHATTPLQGVLKTHYTPAAKAPPQPGSDDALKRATATIGVASQRAAKTSPMYDKKRFRARALQIHLRRARARRARARASGRKLSWNGKSWAVAVAGQRPTAARGNRGGVTIHVATLSGRTFTLDVAKSDSVASVKAKIHAEVAIPPEERCLTFAGELLEDGRTLSDYGIQATATPQLDLRRRGGMQIQLRRRPLTEGRRLLVRGKTFTLDVAASDSVASVKAKIHAKEGIPPEKQRLVFRSKLLEDERTLQDYCVVKDAELELLGRVPGGMKATGGAPAQPSPAGTPSAVTQASSDRAPGPQVDLEHAAPGPAEATIKEKLARMAVEFRGAIQDARRIAGFEPPGTLEEIDTLLEKLIPELDGSLTPDTTKIAAGAGLDAARRGTRDLLPSDAPTLSAPDGAPPPGRPQRMPSTKVLDASEPTGSGTAEPKVEEKTDDEEVRSQRAEKATPAAPATLAAKVDSVDSSEEADEERRIAISRIVGPPTRVIDYVNTEEGLAADEERVKAEAAEPLPPGSRWVEDNGDP